MYTVYIYMASTNTIQLFLDKALALAFLHNFSNSELFLLSWHTMFFSLLMSKLSNVCTDIDALKSVWFL